MMRPGFVDGAQLEADQELTAEVCVVGSGAGGAVTAATLAQGGKQVLVLEEGGHHTRRDFNQREDWAFPTLYQEGGQRTTADYAISILQGRAVGGSTVVNWTTCLRPPPSVLSHWRQRHQVRDLSHEDLLPHLAAMEERLSVTRVTPDAMNRNNRLLYDGCRALNWQVEAVSRNVRGCAQTGSCGMGCPLDAKQSMLVTCLPDAVAHGATVVSRARVDRLEHGEGRVRSLDAALLSADGRTPTGRRLRVRAQRFILSAGALGSPALLIRSGLGGPQVGRRTFLHPVIISAAWHKEPVLACYGAPQSAASHQFADRGERAGFVMEAAPLHPGLMAASIPGMGADHREVMEQFPHVAPHIALVIDGFHPDEPGGTVTVGRSGAPRLHYPVTPRVQEAMAEAQRALARAAFAAGATEVGSTHDPPLRMRSPAEVDAAVAGASYAAGDVLMMSAHVMGGCAMGDRPDDAVVRSLDLRVHGVDNLHVMDGSVFPTSLGVNPQMTIYSVTRLAAHRLLQAWAS